MNEGCETISGVSAVIDYVAVQLDRDSKVEIADILRITPDFFFMKERKKYLYSRKSWMGYDACWTSIYADILFDPLGLRPPTLEMTGQQCREYERLWGADGLAQLIRTINSLKPVWKRLDVAVDYCGDLVTFERVASCIRRKAYKARAQGTLPEIGETYLTIYVGAKTSDQLLRFYVKQGGAAPETSTLRIEIQTRRKHASVLARRIEDVGAVGKIATGVIANKIEFLVKRPSDSNRSRWQTVWWWKRFLTGIEKVSLSQGRSLPDYERKKGWFFSKASSTALMIIDQEGLEQFLAQLRSQRDRLGPDHLKLLVRRAVEPRSEAG